MTLSYNQQVAHDAIVTVLQDSEVDWTLAEIMAFVQEESSFLPSAQRYEPRIHDTSYGLMQMLTGTARTALKFTGTVQEMRQPETSIRLGVAYLDYIWDYLANALGRDPQMMEVVCSYNMGEHGVANHVRMWVAQGNKSEDAPCPDPAYWQRWQEYHDAWAKVFPEPTC